MPYFNQRQNITLVSAVAAYALPVTDPYELYEITSTGPIVIPGTTTFTSSGTLLEGVTYKFKYTADITIGNISFMGELLPTHLRSKTVFIEAYYNGTAWEVSIQPDFMEDDTIAISSLINNPGGHVIANVSNTGINSANSAGEQILASAVIPAGTLGGLGAFAPYEAFRITAWGSCNAVTSKSLLIKAITGATTHIIFDDSATALQGDFKIEVVVSATPPGVFQSEALLIGGDQDPTGYNNTNVNWDFSVAQTIQFIAEENTPTGGLVTFRHLRVEKITI